ncbi:MAG: ribonucleoside triphosphate reductase, partial [Sulfurimonas sp.]|nr:ribonucleoside triphosphate reductase [Sulfurimonas sp.]
SELQGEASERGCERLEDMTYKHFQKEMNQINKAYYEIMTEGDKTGQPFTFPIPTVNITEDFDWYGENTDLLFENTAKIGSSYFQNFIGSQYKRDENGKLVENEEAYKPGHVRSMCCRLQLDLRELLKRGGGLFGSAEMTGSIGVVTLNMARLGYLYKGDKEALVIRIDQLMNHAKSTLEKKRIFIQDMFERGLFPYTSRYLPGFNNHFSTIGINGVNEMILNFTDGSDDISSESGIAFATEILNHMRDRMVEFQEESGNLYNLEATPAEGTTYRFAKEDKKRYGDEIIQAGMGENIYYTNSSQIPVDLTDDPFEALTLQDDLQTKYTGGTVLHLYMQEKVSSTEACRKLVKNVISNFRLPYITVTPLFSVCPKHGYISGEHEFCPKCDEELVNEFNEEQVS